MKDMLSDEQNAEILKALNTAIEQGPWGKSTFLKVIGKNLIQVREDFLSHLSTSTQAQLKKENSLANRMASQADQVEVFVSLYSSDGSNLQSWERILLNLPKQVVSRPIYTNEDDLKAVIKSKENKLNEAYVAIYIHKSNIFELSPDKVAVDKLGNKLLTLKNRSIDLDKISRFVHITGDYQWEQGRLSRQN